jgi:WD40 repeat protein
MDILEYIDNNYEGWEIAEDGKFLYNLGSEDQETVIFDVKNKSLFELPSDMNSYLLFYTQNNINIIICASGNIINIMSMSNNEQSHKLIKQIDAHFYEITYLLKTDKYLISCSNDESIKLWSLDNFEHVNTFNHNEDILCINYYNNILISGDFNGTVKLWNMDTFELINEINVFEYIVSVAISDKYIAFSSSKSKLYIIKYKLNTFKFGHKYTFSNQERYIYFLQFSSDNNYLYSGTADNLIIYSTNVNGCKLLKKYNHNSFVSSHCLTKDNNKILYVDEKKLDCIYTPTFNNFIIELFEKNNLLPHELVLLVLDKLNN